MNQAHLHDPDRRRWLRASAATAAAPLAGGALTLAPRPAQSRVKTSAHIVIAGSGLAGIALAHRLRGLLEGARITIVDAKEEHNY